MAKNIRILFVNPISGIEGFLPIGLSSLIAVLKKDNFKVNLFDTTYYEVDGFSDRALNEFVGEFLPADIEKFNIAKEKVDYLLKFSEKVKEVNPAVIAVTVPTAYNFPLAKRLIESITNFQGVVIVGGKHVTMSPQEVISLKRVDVICRGEGETPFLEFCNRLEDGKSFDGINNLWIKKKDGSIIKNEIGPLEDVNKLPFLDWSLYDERHFYKPFAGKVYRYGHLELSRGCPYRCSYCANEKLQEMFKGKGKYFRQKNLNRALTEIEFLKSKYKLEIIKFWDEEFLLKSEKELEEFAEIYREFKLPFLITARLDSVTERKAQLLKEMGCVNVSAGIESGNDEIRFEILNRRMSREEIIRGIDILNKHKIRTSTLNMIGIPFETRKNIFETIELNRTAHAQNSSVMILQPWEGTKIRELCVKEGFMSEDDKHYDYIDSCLNMPQISRDEIKRLRKTFTLYRKVPKILYPLVRLCEKDGKYRDAGFKFLHKIFKSI